MGNAVNKSHKRLTAIFLPALYGGDAERTMLNLAQEVETALARTMPCPPRESWQPFELETVVDQYVSTLLGR